MVDSFTVGDEVYFIASRIGAEDTGLVFRNGMKAR